MNLSWVGIVILLQVWALKCSAEQKLNASNVTASNATTKSKERSVGTCVSQGGRFPRFAQENKPPRNYGRRGRKEDFPFCRLYKGKTCCDRAQAEMAFVSVRRMMLGGEGSDKCVGYWEALECAICHPKIGIQSGPPFICQSFCDLVFDSCKGAFFSAETKSQTLAPCGPRDPICARGNEWATNGTQLCQLAGFQVFNDVHEFHGAEKDIDSWATYGKVFCFNGDPQSTGFDFGQTSISERTGRSGFAKLVADSLRELLGPVDLGENIVWLVAGLVLTAAAALMRWRRMRQKRNRAALFASRNVQVVRTKQQSNYAKVASVANRKQK